MGGGYYNGNDGVSAYDSEIMNVLGGSLVLLIVLSFIVLVSRIICLIVTCNIARKKGKDAGVWFLLALSFGWLATIVVAISVSQINQNVTPYVAPVVQPIPVVQPTTVATPIQPAPQPVSAPIVQPTPVATPTVTTATKPQTRYFNPYSRANISRNTTSKSITVKGVQYKYFNQHARTNTVSTAPQQSVQPTVTPIPTVKPVTPTVKPVTPTATEKPVITPTYKPAVEPVQKTTAKPVTPTKPATNVYGTPIKPAPTPVKQVKEEEEIACWQCSACGMMNEEPSEFCNNCGCKRS